MRKIYILILLLTLTSVVSNGQWTSYYRFNIGYGPSNVPDYFEDVAFSNRATGIYAYNTYISSSIGNYTTGELTTDNCQNWNQVYRSQDYQGSTAGLYYGYPHTFYILEEVYDGIPFTELHKISDDGSNYQGLPGPQYTIDMSIPDTNNVFTLSANSVPFLQITDSFCSISKCFHNNYIIKDSMVSMYATKIFFTDSLNGFLLISDSSNQYCHTIQRSTNGGTSWSNSFWDTSININKFFFLSPTIGFAVGDSGKVIKTIDSGNTWQYINTNQSIALNAVLFLNDTMGYVAGNSNLIMQTSNGGLSWQYNTIASPDSGNFTKLMLAPPSPIGVYSLLKNISNSNNAEIFVAYPYSGLGINEIKSFENALTLFPNPTTSLLTLSLPNTTQKAIINLYDMLGEKVQPLLITHLS